MQVVMYVPVRKVPTMDDADAIHESDFYRFRSRKLAEALNDMCVHFDRIDNDYIDGLPSLIGVIYVGDWDACNMEADDKYIYEGNDIIYKTQDVNNDDDDDKDDSDAHIIPDGVDPQDYLYYILDNDFAETWLKLAKAVGKKYMDKRAYRFASYGGNIGVYHDDVLNLKKLNQEFEAKYINKQI
jgi:hypothetical protein